MLFNILTIFPDILDSYINKGMIRIAQEKKLIKFKAIDLRDFSVDKRGTVDDKPYGGGPGQIMMVEPVYNALKKLKVSAKGGSASGGKSQPSSRAQVEGKSKVVLLSARGKKWTQQIAQRYSKLEAITFVCPRYEGHDERIRKFIDDEISIGDFVLTGGELGALVIIDSITRLLPGVLGEKESLKEESHSTPGYLEYPQYTRPEIFEYKSTPRGRRDAKFCVSTTAARVPRVLLSGHHKNIQEWRRKKSQTLTK